MRGLEMVSTVAPLLGLLGTVTGMVKTFSGINQIGARVDPAILAGGIWEALIATVAGLMVAIPALAAHYIIDSRIDSIRSTMTDAVTYILSKSEG
jgi:biopolymer transport protein ExbB